MTLSDIEVRELEAAALQMRRDILRLCHEAGRQNAHLGGCMSAVETLAVLYRKVLNVNDPEIRTKNWDARDRFVLGKGHAGIALYAALRQAGLLDERHFSCGIRGEGAVLFRHPKRNPALGIEFSGGSLGQGIGYAVGLAEAARRKNSNHRVFVMVGDGECDEGAVWESAAYAAHRGLDNFTVIVDKNGLQLDGATSDVLDLGDIAAKFSSFGFQTSLVDGHDVRQLHAALTVEHPGRPLVVIARTVKGKGVPFAENRVEWHDNFLDDGLYEKALAALGGNAAPPPDPISRIPVRSDSDRDAGPVSFSPPETTVPPDYAADPRKIVGCVCARLAANDPRFALVYSDCGVRIGVGESLAANPGACFETGIAEQNQVALASGLAMEGFHVFAVAYAPFITARVLDHVRSCCGYMGAPIKLIGLSAGFASSDLGSTHTALEDIADMRAIPGLTVLAPSNGAELTRCLEEALRIPGPVYVRVTAPFRPGDMLFPSSETPCSVRSTLLRKGTDVGLVACGTILAEALLAADLLAERGLSCAVVDMPVIKPFDETVMQELSGCRLVVSVEEHNIIGGLGSAVAEFSAEQDVFPRLVRIGIPDRFYLADEPSAVRRRAGLAFDQIAATIENEFGKLPPKEFLHERR